MDKGVPCSALQPTTKPDITPCAIRGSLAPPPSFTYSSGTTATSMQQERECNPPSQVLVGPQGMPPRAEEGDGTVAAGTPH